MAKAPKTGPEKGQTADPAPADAPEDQASAAAPADATGETPTEATPTEASEDAPAEASESAPDELFCTCTAPNVHTSAGKKFNGQNFKLPASEARMLASEGKVQIF